MKIQNDSFVAIDYKLTLGSGEEVDASEPGEPLSFIFGRGQMIPGLERQIEGMAQGEKASIVVEAEEGYGEVNPEMFRDLPRENFPPDMELEAGMRLQAMGPHGPILLSVKSVQDDSVTVDLNHPLAGKQLHFDVTVVELRDATEDEILAMEASCSPSDCAGCGGTCH